MKVPAIVLLISLLAAGVFAQTFSRSVGYIAAANRVAGATPAFSPTNISGYPAVAWYVVNDSYSTNGGTIQLADQWTNAFHLTNTTATQTPIRIVDGLNGLDYLTGPITPSSATRLRCLHMTNAQPTEYFMVMCFTNQAGFPALTDGSLSGVARQRLDYTADTMRFFAGGTARAWNFTTNQWQVLDIVYNGDLSYVLTNNSLSVSNNPGTTACDGLTLFNSNSFNASPSNMCMAELVIYGSVLGATERNNLYNYLTNKYALPQ